MRSKPVGTDEVGSKVDGKVKTCRRRAQPASTGNKYNPKESKGIYVDSHRVVARLDLDQSFEVGNRRLGGRSCSCSLLDGQLLMEVLDCNL